MLDTFPALTEPAAAAAPACCRAVSASSSPSPGRCSTKPRLLILDEPTEGIQPNVVAEIEQVIVDLTRRGDLTVLLVEQHVGVRAALHRRATTCWSPAASRAAATAARPRSTRSARRWRSKAAGALPSGAPIQGRDRSRGGDQAAEADLRAGLDDPWRQGRRRSRCCAAGFQTKVPLVEPIDEVHVDPRGPRRGPARWCSPDRRGRRRRRARPVARSSSGSRPNTVPATL